VRIAAIVISALMSQAMEWWPRGSTAHRYGLVNTRDFIKSR
jgi:hypothetical protein